MTEIVVTAPARLHFGMLDPAGLGVRRFGGFGVGIEAPRVIVEVGRRRDRSRAAVVAFGSQADRATDFARRARDAFGLRYGVEVNVREAIPPHSGLGSGTKLGLAIARGFAELAGVSPGPEELAKVSGRGARSSVGCWTFTGPGLVVEAGVREDECISPLLARYPMPDRWRCVLALPRGVEGLSGDAEERFFGRLREPAGVEAHVSRMLLTALLPGLLTADIDEFGAGLSEVQREVGSMFAAQQGGVFHPRAAPLVDALLGLGVGAVGQSSWGPTVYGIVDGPERAADVADRLRVEAGAGTDVSVADFDRRGARVERARLGRAAV
ncbi:MAG TPA: beta-ribofuranosylaminobenzene 5'-phosphate synthase family protein [Solirubrobacteraceae bacterium]|nr:beta-ribofuranosylaminobenzene 5'-phosphate synthase family protein [Solirubrobacteraceae bacterium]